jgi:quercetin dioxygenase-like cupin family protein
LALQREWGQDKETSMTNHTKDGGLVDQRSLSPMNDERTHGSPQRPARELDASLRRIAVMETIERMRGEQAFATDGRNSETVLHDGIARVVLTALEQDREVGSESGHGRATLFLLEGEGTLTQGDEQSSLQSGDLALLAPAMSWTFKASRPCAFVACFWQDA